MCSRVVEYLGDDVIGMLSVVNVADACQYGNELSGSIKCGEFLD
jgi:hypothetical protein